MRMSYSALPCHWLGSATEIAYRSCVARRYKYYFKTTKGEEQPRRYDSSNPAVVALL